VGGQKTEIDVHDNKEEREVHVSQPLEAAAPASI
jgi:hypothetical protein